MTDRYMFGLRRSVGVMSMRHRVHLPSVQPGEQYAEQGNLFWSSLHPEITWGDRIGVVLSSKLSAP